MVKYDENHERGCCPYCGNIAFFENGDAIESEMWETYYCERCKKYFSEQYAITYIGYETHDE